MDRVAIRVSSKDPSYFHFSCESSEKVGDVSEVVGKMIKFVESAMKQLLSGDATMEAMHFEERVRPALSMYEVGIATT